VAAEQLTKDGVDVLHTIGGDDTNTTAADLAAYLHENDYELTVVGLPKTIDNDVVPIRQSLGAWTAAEQGSIYAQNIIAEHSSNPRMLIVHEVMGRNCGWLTAETARRYHAWVAEQEFVPGLGNDPRAGTCTPCMSREHIDIAAEAERGSRRSWTRSAASTSSCPRAPASRTSSPSWKPLGRRCRATRSVTCMLDKVNPGAWFAKQFAAKLGAEKTMVQKSGYFSRSAAANDEDLALIKRSAPTSPWTRPCVARAAWSARTRSRATSCARSSSRASGAPSRSTPRSRGSRSCCARSASSSPGLTATPDPFTSLKESTTSNGASSRLVRITI
jgi:pyrophosphate--fructose-6-phosphate 1-phosphotransferase